jgi:squalene-associated FAD-dependent desaturase
MKKCIIIGGGIAGLSAAAFLVKHGVKITLLESSPKLGGRAYSFKDQKTQDEIDNGQHIIMGCYSDTNNFLKIIGAENNFVYQKSLELNFLKHGNKLIKLKSLPFFYPLNLLTAILNYRAISFRDRLSIVKFMMKVPFVSHQKLVTKNVKEWLLDENQSDNTINSLWRIIAVGALNTNVHKASASMFREILVKIFFKGNYASTIILPKHGLSESFILKAKIYIENNGGEIKLSSQVKDILVPDDKIIKMSTTEESFSDFDYVISAVPFYALNKIYPELFVHEEIYFEYSSILNIHFWLKKNLLKEHFYGLINSTLHWIFNKKNHINLVISDADYLIEKTGEEIFILCLNELKKFIDIDEQDILHYRVLKERRATFIPSNKITYSRPSCKTKISNLFLAGDWTDTGLPSTIESAVKSGRIASEFVINS